MACSFGIESMARGYHEYKSVWEDPGIKWKERQERRFKLEAPKIASVSSPLLIQTGSDVTPVL